MAAPKSTTALLLISAALLLFLSGASGQAPEPEPAHSAPASSFAPDAPTPDCMTNLLNMSDCLSYVTAGSNTTKPDKACCPELAGLVESNPVCLCYLLDKNTTASYGISIDMSKALKLPSVCGVNTPPASLCSVITGGGGSPTGSPGAAPEGLASSPSAGSTSAASSGAGVSVLASILALSIAFALTF